MRKQATPRLTAKRRRRERSQQSPFPFVLHKCRRLWHRCNNPRVVVRIDTSVVVARLERLGATLLEVSNAMGTTSASLQAFTEQMRTAFDNEQAG